MADREVSKPSYYESKMWLMDNMDIVMNKALESHRAQTGKGIAEYVKSNIETVHIAELEDRPLSIY